MKRGDTLTDRLMRLRSQLGSSYDVTLRVSRKGVTWLSCRSRYEEVEATDEEAALRKLNKSKALRKGLTYIG